MNDLLYLYLDFDPDDNYTVTEIEKLLPKIDDLLKSYGWEYMGFRNMYRPIADHDGDDTCHDAKNAVINAEWLKKYNPHFAVGTQTRVCDLNEIIIDRVGNISEEKFNRYEKYYKAKGSYVHGIVVDENNVLRDGYITYLLAKDNERIPDIMLARKNQMLKKAVIGRYVTHTANGFEKTNEDKDVWYYDIEPAVIPGDILKVQTNQGERMICVERIIYLVGSHDCSIYRDVLAQTTFVCR